MSDLCCQTKMQPYTHTHIHVRSQTCTFYVVFATQLWKIMFMQDLFLECPKINYKT